MEREKVLKALECCSAESLAQKKCRQCPYHKRSSVQCIGRLCSDARDLILEKDLEQEGAGEKENGG
jgi:hypothetical protein